MLIAAAMVGGIVLLWLYMSRSSRPFPALPHAVYRYSLADHLLAVARRTLAHLGRRVTLSKGVRLIVTGEEVRVAGLTVGGAALFPLREAGGVCHAGGGHRVPSEDCSCGFHGYWSRRSARHHERQMFGVWTADVRIRGTVLVAELGARGQMQSIARLYLPNCAMCGREASVLAKTPQIEDAHLPELRRVIPHGGRLLAVATCDGCAQAPLQHLETVDEFAMRLAAHGVELRRARRPVLTQGQIAAARRQQAARDDAAAWLDEWVMESRDPSVWRDAWPRIQAAQDASGRDVTWALARDASRVAPDDAWGAWVALVLSPYLLAGLVGGEHREHWSRLAGIAPATSWSAYVSRCEDLYGEQVYQVMSWWSLLDDRNKLALPLSAVEQVLASDLSASDKIDALRERVTSPRSTS